MTREVKVGLAVLMVLLVVFGVVLANRLMRGSESAAGPGETQTSAGVSREAESDRSASSSAKGSTHTAGKPTIVAPETQSAAAASSPVEVGQWAVSTQTDGRSGAETPANPPSYMPNPPQPSASETYDRYGSSYGGSAAQQAVQSPIQQDPQAEQTAPAPLPGAGQADPFQGRTPGPSQASPNTYSSPVQQSNPAVPSLRLVDPSGTTTGTPTAAAGSDYAAPSQTYQQSPYGAQMQTAPYSAYSPGSAHSPVQQSPVDSSSPWQAGQSGSSSAAGDSSSSGYSTAGSPYGKSAASGAAGLQPTAARSEDGSYEVQPNDSYWTISEKFYGTGAYFRALAEHNRSRVPNQERLSVGDVIQVPELAELEKNYPDLCPKPEHREAVKTQGAALAGVSLPAGGPTYTVQEGDTLYDIAKYELGDVSRWVEIYQLNRQILGEDYDYLRPGLKLVLPADVAGSQDPVTRLPGPTNTYQR